MASPLTLVGLIFAFHVIGTICDLLWLESFANILTMMTILLALVLAVWVAGSMGFAGRFPKVIGEIDAFCLALFEVISAVIMQQVQQPATKGAKAKTQ